MKLFRKNKESKKGSPKPIKHKNIIIDFSQNQILTVIDAESKELQSVYASLFERKKDYCCLGNNKNELFIPACLRQERENESHSVICDEINLGKIKEDYLLKQQKWVGNVIIRLTKHESVSQTSARYSILIEQGEYFKLDDVYAMYKFSVFSYQFENVIDEYKAGNALDIHIEKSTYYYDILNEYGKMVYVWINKKDYGGCLDFCDTMFELYDFCLPKEIAYSYFTSSIPDVIGKDGKPYERINFGLIVKFAYKDSKPIIL